MADSKSDPADGQLYQSVSVCNLQSVCEKFEGIVKQTFGPNGQAGLILNSSGQPLLSTTGIELLRSVNFRDPVARIIINAVSKHHEVTGDGSKEFILILIELIRLCLKLGGNYPHESIPLKLARSFGTLHETVLPKAFAQINDRLLNSNLVTNDWPTDKIMNCLVSGFVAGKFGERVNQVLIELVLKLVNQPHRENGSNLNLVINHLLDHFAVTCICVDGGPISTSIVQEGAVVSRNFATLNRPADQQAISFVVVKYDLNYLQTGDGIVFDVNSQNVKHALESSTMKLKELLLNYQSKNIQLILTNRNFSQVTLYLCSQNSISVIHSIEDDELERIVSLSAIEPLCDPFDAIEPSNISNASAIKPIIVGLHQWVRIIFPSHLPFIQVQHAIIRGPNQMVSKQYGFTIKNCLKCIRAWCQKSQTTRATEDCASDNDNLASSSQITTVTPTSNFSVLPVGGCWAFLLHRQLRIHSEEFLSDEDAKMACQLLADALLIVPMVLLKNSWNGYRFRFVEVCHAMEQMDDGLKCIDGLTGHIRSAADVMAREELHSKFVLLNNLLSLMRQLLRLDGILHVEKNIH